MKPLLRLLAGISLIATAATPLAAQSDAAAVPLPAPLHRISPHDAIYARIGGDLLTLVYGRPYTKDPKSGQMRTVWGGKLVPPGKIWRVGADEATVFSTQMPLRAGEGASAVDLPAGIYSVFLFAAPGGKSPSDIQPQLVFNRQVGQWGEEYHPEQDAARVPMNRNRVETPVHQFTMAIDRGTDKTNGVIKLIWEDTQFSVPFTVVKP